jgi:hypothetical protein
MRVGLVCGDDPACAALRHAARPARAFSAASRGYLVPAAPFDATVHSVYRSACNLAHGDTLIILAVFASPEGPTTVRLDAAGSIDLRDWFHPGEAVTSRGAWLAFANVRVDCGHARTWAPPQQALYAPTPIDLARGLQVARTRLDAQRTHCASVLHREGAAVCRDLEHACRSLESGAAQTQVARLIGWGEGLTPAGDDFVVGLLAALQILAGDDARRSFLHRLCATVAAASAYTTAVAAHYLRLAAHDHFNADLHDLRDALLAGDDPARLERSLDTVLSRGATSGGDLLAGLLAGIRAWVPPRVPQRTRTS